MGKLGSGKSVCCAPFYFILKKKLKMTMTNLGRASMRENTKLADFKTASKKRYSEISPLILEGYQYQSHSEHNLFPKCEKDRKADTILGIGSDASLFIVGELLTNFIFAWFKMSFFVACHTEDSKTAVF